MKKSLRSQVLNVLEKRRKASSVQVCEDMGLDLKRDKQRVNMCLRNLHMTGKCRRTDKGAYEYTTPPPPKPPEKQGKIWRAMRCSICFSTADIQLLSGCNRSYIKKYMTFLMREGFLVQVEKNGCTRIYQLTTKAIPEVPIYSRKKTPFVSMGNCRCALIPIKEPEKN